MATFPASMEEQITNGESQELSFRTLHTYANVKNVVDEERLVVPFGSLLNKYRHFLKPLVRELPLNHTLYLKYRFSPKSLSLDLYDTTEYWASLMELNNCISISDFDFEESIKVYDPTQILGMVNEILILEEIIK